MLNSHVSFIAYLYHAETEGKLRTAPCCHFTFPKVCNITECNLLLTMPTGRQEPRPVGVVELTNYRERAVRKGAGGPDTLRLL